MPSPVMRGNFGAGFQLPDQRHRTFSSRDANYDGETGTVHGKEQLTKSIQRGPVRFEQAKMNATFMALDRSIPPCGMTPNQESTLNHRSWQRRNSEP